jgi:hypothetical protein
MNWEMFLQNVFKKPLLCSNGISNIELTSYQPISFRVVIKHIGVSETKWQIILG